MSTSQSPEVPAFWISTASTLSTAPSEHLTNAAASLTKNDAATLEAHSQLVSVPIDEKRALTLKVSPTYTLDVVNGVTSLSIICLKKFFLSKALI